MKRARPGPAWVALYFGLLGLSPLRADPPGDAPNGQIAPAPTPAPPPPGFFEQPNLLPDPDGLRAKLADHGVAFTLFYTGEVFGNPIGGYRQGTVYDGLVEAGIDIDLDKLAGWKGLKLHALGYQSHGPSGTDLYVRDLNRFSSIDAFDTTRLFEVWVDASLFDNVIDLRLGQVAQDSEFALTQGGVVFVHSNFGNFPGVSLNVPAPGYPQADPGVRLRLNSPDARFYFQSGVYAGNPNADRDGDPNPNFRPGTAYNDYGVRFPISGNQGALAMFEAGYLWQQGKDDHGLPGDFRLGGYYHTGEFSDLHLDDSGRSLASPQSTGKPEAHEGSGGVYAVAEQVIYRSAPPPAPKAAEPAPKDGKSAPADAAAPAAGQELRVFSRFSLAPEDRSLADLYFETGMNLRGLIPTRSQDLLGLGFTYTDISSDLRKLAVDENRFNGTRNARPDFEAVLELTYQMNLTPWLQLQPDVQFIIHPGGSGRNDDALVVGVRTVMTF